MVALDSVLDTLDKDLQNSLERLNSLLRFKSISTDPAFASHCKEAADWLVSELNSIGFDVLLIR